MFITSEFLQGRKGGTLNEACKEAQEWFANRFPAGAEVENVVADCPNNRLDWIVWLAFNASATTEQICSLVEGMLADHADENNDHMTSARNRYTSAMANKNHPAWVAKRAFMAVLFIVDLHPYEKNRCRRWAANILGCSMSYMPLDWEVSF